LMVENGVIVKVYSTSSFSSEPFANVKFDSKFVRVVGICLRLALEPDGHFSSL